MSDPLNLRELRCLGHLHLDGVVAIVLDSY